MGALRSNASGVLQSNASGVLQSNALDLLQTNYSGELHEVYVCNLIPEISNMLMPSELIVSPTMPMFAYAFPKYEVFQNIVFVRKKNILCTLGLQSLFHNTCFESINYVID